MFTNPRYLTRGISEGLQPELQLLLWTMIDHMEGEKDYLQVFDLSPASDDGIMIQHIRHHQEQPEFSEEIDVLLVEPIEAKIFVIDDGDHSTMLFAEEY